MIMAAHFVLTPAAPSMVKAYLLVRNYRLLMSNHVY